MKLPYQKRQGTAGTVPKAPHNNTDRPIVSRIAAQIQRVRTTARCLDLRPIFVGDLPLTAELFDRRGNHVESRVWP